MTRSILIRVVLAAACAVLSSCALPAGAKVGIGLAATQIPRLHRAVRVDPQRSGPVNPAKLKHPLNPVYADLGMLETKNTAYHAEVQKHYAEIYNDFSLYTVEFDDQGLFWNRDRAADAVKCIFSEASNDPPPDRCNPAPLPAPLASRTFTRPDRSGVLIFTLVHGWKHGCQVCDTNLSCWREELQVLADLEKARVAKANSDANRAGPPEVPRRVVGVYVAWSGKGNIWPQVILDDFDFVDRKETAQKIGRTDGSKLFSDLQGQYSILKGIEEKRNASPGSRMYTFGHSFGGALLYVSMQAVVREHAAQAEAVIQDPKSDPNDPRRKFQALGDKVFLLNPAFEALLFEGFHEDSLKDSFDPDQEPVLVNITSETDQVTHYVFPFGRTAFLPLEVGQVGALRGKEFKEFFAAAGHLERHRTHELAYKSDDKPATLPPGSWQQKLARDLESVIGSKPGYQRRCECDTSLLKSRANFLQDAQKTAPLRVQLRTSAAQSVRSPLNNLVAPAVPAKRAPPQIVGDFALTPYQSDPGETYQTGNPYFVVYASKEIINGHSDIFNPNFIRFIVEYLSLYTEK